jgi:hypothetical protein
VQSDTDLFALPIVSVGESRRIRYVFGLILIKPPGDDW